jgi:hypothetical protein
MSEINSNPGKFKLIHRKKGDCGKCYVLDIVTKPVPHVMTENQ